MWIRKRKDLYEKKINHHIFSPCLKLQKLKSVRYMISDPTGIALFHGMLISRCSKTKIIVEFPSVKTVAKTLDEIMIHGLWKGSCP